MKNKVSAVHLDLTEYRSGGPALGNITFFRRNNPQDDSRLTSTRRVYPRNIARALEAQRLFLAQLEKAK